MRIGNLLMTLGVALVAIGAAIRFTPGLVSWFGTLPGDIRIESENSRVVIPITSMVVVSIAATVIVNLIGIFLRNR
jgi:hypothetical protein